MIKVTNKNAMEAETHKFVTEASTLGFPVIRDLWPMSLETDLGNGMKLHMYRRDRDGAIYKQDLGCIRLVVFND